MRSADRVLVSAHYSRPLRGRSDILGLQTLVSLTDRKFHSLTVVQDTVAFSANRTEVHEYVIPAVAGYETKTLAGVEPFHAARGLLVRVAMKAEPRLTMKVVAVAVMPESWILRRKIGMAITAVVIKAILSGLLKLDMDTLLAAYNYY